MPLGRLAVRMGARESQWRRTWSGRADLRGHLAERIARKVKEGNAKVYDADLSSYFDTIPHDKLLSALEMRIADGSVLNLVRQWLKACAREPNGVTD